MSKRSLMGSAMSSVVAAFLIAGPSMSAPMARGVAPTVIPAGLEIGCPTHFYLGNNPSDSDAPDWSHNAQGVANDGRHWYFTHQLGLLKYEANWEPSSDAVDIGLIKSVGVPAELAAKGINHFGDLDHYAGYLFVPFESPGRPEHELVAAVAVFRASDLEMVDWVSLEPDLRRTGWLAIHPVEKALYTSHDGLIAGTPLMRYSLDLSKIENSIQGDFVGASEQVGVLDFDGAAVAGKFEYMQGGVFTPWGDLYLSAGKTGESAAATRGGLHLFRRTDDGSAFQLIESSVNEAAAGDPVFAYQYDPIGFTEDDGEEPEGLDWWNRDNAPDSLYLGQLHAILLQNLTLDANIWLKHYRVVYGCQLTEDSDADGVADGEEVYSHNTHPLLADTDRDGQSDGHELTCDSDPLDTAALASDLDGDRLPDCVDADDDGDGQTDAGEAACGSNPSDPNSLAPDFDGDLQPDCLDTDDDNDGSADTGDLCPKTSLATIRYGSCDSGVVDFILDGARAGCSVSQSIERLAAASTTKGQLVSQVDKLLTDLQKQGRLLPRQKDSIKACVAP